MVIVKRATFLISFAGNYSTESFRQKGVITVNSRSKRLVDVSASELETDVRWGLVRRILESQQFAKSARLHDFLLYVCRCALENRSDEIIEHTIG